MMIRSPPPRSMNLAESPMPAPAPRIGSPRAMLAFRRSRTCWRVYGFGIPLVPFCTLRDQPQQRLRRRIRERRVVDVQLELPHRNARIEPLPQRLAERCVGFGYVTRLPLAADGGGARRRQEHDGR